jgi:hypothetical protein
MNSTDLCDGVVVLRQQRGAGWRVELSHVEDGGRVFTAVVAEKEQALKLAAQMCPNVPVRVISAE